MTRSEIALLLGAAAARDQRTVGEADVLAWHEDLGDLDLADARDALRRHYRESTDRIMPAHVRRLVKIIKDERRAAGIVRALPPGKHQDDPEREARIAKNRGKVQAVLQQIAAKRSIPDDQPVLTGSDLIRHRAIQRAHAERKGQNA